VLHMVITAGFLIRGHFQPRSGKGGKSGAGGVGTTLSGYWRDDSVLFGGFAHRSHFGVNADSYDRIGGDVRINYKDLSVAGGYIRGSNDQTEEDKDIWFGEAEYFVFPWMVPYLRYENLCVNNVNNGDQERFIVGATMLLRANIRVNVEGRIYTKNEPREATGGEIKDDDQIAFRLDWAF
jgi:predicted porin